MEFNRGEIMGKMLTNPATFEKLAEIQDQMREMCLPRDKAAAQYDEFYKVKSEYGFIKITIPQKRNK